MKTINYILGILTLGIISCTDLTEEIYSDITEDSHHYEAGDAIKVIGAAYTNLRQWGDCGSGKAPMLSQEICTDAAVFPANGSGWDDGGVFRRMHQHQWNSEQLQVNELWSVCYSGILLANRAISIISKEDFPLLANESRDELIAEMRGLRAFYYWYVLDNFGDAPLVIEPTDQLPALTSRKDLFDFIVEELKDILQKSQLSDSKEGYYGRFNKWVAKTLLANVYLNAEVYTGKAMWNECLLECEEILSSDQYELDINYTDPFKVDNEKSLENIWVIPYDEIYAPEFNYHLAALHGSNQATYNLVGSPWGAGAYKGVPQFIDTYDIDDERLSATWLLGEQYASDGTPLLGAYDQMGKPLIFVNTMPDGIFTGEAEGARWLKYEIKMGAMPGLSNDLVLFRLTQVYMMKAECLLRLNQSDEAAKIVTKIRERAFKHTPEKAKVTGEQLLQPSKYNYGIIKNYKLAPQTKQYPEKYGRFYDELGWEFAGESYRRRDMIRFGHFSKAAWLSHEPSDEGKLLFPIPQKVIDTNPNLHQNPNY